MSAAGFDAKYRLFRHIDIRTPDLDWFVALNPQVSRIADFGCGTGTETLALMQAFDAAEAIGIDMDAPLIAQATDFLGHIKNAAKIVSIRAGYGNAEHREWWETRIPEFVKGLVLDQIPAGFREGVRERSVRFIEADISRPVDGVPSDYFDLAYCNKVLYHILCDDGDSKVQSAVSQMARVVAEARWVVAVEPVSCGPEGGHTVDLTQFFLRAGLREWPAAYRGIEPQGVLRRYVYRKVSGA